MIQRPLVVGLYAILCLTALAFLYLVSLIIFVIQMKYEDEMINGCVTLAQYRETHGAFGAWVAQLALSMNEVDAQNYCRKQDVNVTVMIYATYLLICAYTWS
ncbi:hypothetical protein AZE42_04002 [Rhizopogon vesiculosus]|uniref:Uncharacterized protein n=1 Tax=Rhizopogon vesiculosus TaxID=180088 RepID=A0A1J8R3Q6_9AGAM|nr:hypothetical protein AZE42_04002 [Rhizopogon vesiculosus]